MFRFKHFKRCDFSDAISCLLYFAQKSFLNFASIFLEETRFSLTFNPFEIPLQSFYTPNTEKWPQEAEAVGLKCNKCQRMGLKLQLLELLPHSYNQPCVFVTFADNITSRSSHRPTRGCSTTCDRWCRT